MMAGSNESGLLGNIESPKDFRGYTNAQLEKLCAEVRSYMIECCATNPGHLASSLGAVELTAGLHYVFDTPTDKIIFDVGHQAYAHKILTGRKEAFRKNRKRDGLSGFPNIDESPYDAFGVGHSSTSISAALGLAEAERLRGGNAKVVAVIGDGALTGGLAFEGLNNAGDSQADLLVVINDNNQSIDRNIGALHKHLLKITTDPVYNRLRTRIWNHFGETPFREWVRRWIKGWKSYLVKKSGGDLFEALGFRYFGPIDGNDISQVVDTLSKVKDIKGPRILHCITTKGKGYAPAEADPTTWHAPGKFNPETGERIISPHPADRYQDVFGEVLTELARMDSRVVGITPAMASGCGMSALAEAMPERFFDVGIEEEHAVTFAAGLAAGGMKPFCNIYSAFSQRAYDQIIHDVALQNLDVVLCFDRAGLVGEDGATHQGAFDLAAYRSIPGLTIAAPADELELKQMMYTAFKGKGPFIIRYPRGMGDGTPWREAEYMELTPGRGERLREGSKIAVVAIGPVAKEAAKAADEAFSRTGRKAAVYNIRYLKPVDTAMLEEIAEGYDCIISLEDGAMKGGLRSELSEYLAEHGFKGRFLSFGIPDEFIMQDTQRAQRKECGLDMESILGILENEFKKS